MSSQTTDTPGTTTTISVADRSGATFQTYPTPGSFANQRFRDSQPHQKAPTRFPHANKDAVFQAIQKGVGRYLSASAAATRITLHAPGTRHKSIPKQGPERENPRNGANFGPSGPLGARISAEMAFCGARHTGGPWGELASYPEKRQPLRLPETLARVDAKHA